jgi:phosphoribosylanthranilate isomerase
MTRVKICGLTTGKDVKLAVGYRAWACGFVLSDSPRRVEVARAAELTPMCGHSLAVAVVTTEAPEWIAGAVAAGGFDVVQLSAGADGPGVAAVRAAALRRGLRPLVIAAADTPDAVDADLVLLDARSPGRYGGTGRTLDWTAVGRSIRSGLESPASADALAPTLAAAVDPSRLVLAGGLTPSNVAEAVAALRPFAVDVASGVEREPGRKDPAKLRTFFAAVSSSPVTGDRTVAP